MDVKKIDVNQQYRVELAEKVTLYGQVVYPGHELVLRGDQLKKIADKVKDAHAIS